MTNEIPPIYLIPGLGANAGCYPGPWRELPNSTILEWPEYHGSAFMPEVARFASTAWQLPQGAILIGSSFGGLMACEISKFLPLHAVILVCSTTSKEKFTNALRMRRLLRFVWLRFVQRTLSFAMPLLEKIWGRAPTPLARAVLDSIQMFTTCQPGFYRNMFHAILTWEGLKVATTRLIVIHGRQDAIILPPAEADLLLEGGHLIPITHARECVNFILKWLEQDFSKSMKH